METLKQDYCVVNSVSRSNRQTPVVSSFHSSDSLKEMFFTDVDFPSMLRDIPQAPKRLFLKGRFLPSLRYIGIVGTREPDKWGLMVTRTIASLLVKEGFGIISGLARGIDTCAHQAALECGGYTIAVIPSGIGKIYPRENLKLFRDIVDSGGGVFSEYAHSSSPFRGSFVQRNRLISGLCAAVVFVQGCVSSGSMHTARFAVNQGRNVFVAVSTLPENADSWRCRGNHFLVQGDDSAVGVPTKKKYPHQVFSFGSSREFVDLLSFLD